MRPSSSARNPFITDITMIRVATPERDPEQREDRDDRDEAFLPPRPQIAERHHPLEGVEDHGKRASLSRTAERVAGAKPADG